MLEMSADNTMLWGFAAAATCMVIANRLNRTKMTLTEAASITVAAIGCTTIMVPIGGETFPFGALAVPVYCAAKALELLC